MSFSMLSGIDFRNRVVKSGVPWVERNEDGAVVFVTDVENGE